MPFFMHSLYSLVKHGAMRWADFLITIMGISLDLPFSKSLIISRISSMHVSSIKIEQSIDVDMYDSNDSKGWIVKPLLLSNNTWLFRFLASDVK